MEKTKENGYLWGICRLCGLEDESEDNKLLICSHQDIDEKGWICEDYGGTVCAYSIFVIDQI